MYKSSLAKKFKPAKRAWKSFTNKLQSKLQTLKIPKTIKTTAQRVLTFCSLHLFIPFRKRFLTKSSYRSRYRYQYNRLDQYHHQNQLQKNFSAICIDNLYSDAHTETSKCKEVIEEEVIPRNEKNSLYSVEDAWNAIVAKSPQLRSVDERAEEFIDKFREDMKIQREKSLLEFQEMLARSA